MQQRRDSILKQQGSVKSEKRVSIKPTPSGSNLASLNINNNNNNNNNAKLQPNVEYISEAPSSSKGARLTTKPPAGKLALWSWIQWFPYALCFSCSFRSPTSFADHHQKRFNLAISAAALLVHRVRGHRGTAAACYNRARPTHYTPGAAGGWVGASGIYRAEMIRSERQRRREREKEENKFNMCFLLSAS